MDSMMPVNPATTHWKRNAMENSMGVSKRTLPPQMVASQLNVLMPVGMETSMVESVKNALPNDVMPMVNMWCAHTPRLMNAILTEAVTMAGYPKIALRENTGMISL